MTGTPELIPELPPTADDAGRLGRHRQWHPENENYRVRTLLEPVPTAELPNKLWTRYGKPLNQGDVGACTIFSSAGTMKTLPLARATSRAARRLIEPGNLIALYEYETAHDDVPGQYPAEDTGSTVLAAMQTLKAQAIIDSYWWGTDETEIATALALHGPGVCGIDWYEGFDRPDANGVVQQTGQIRGGHAISVRGRLTSGGETVAVLENSWGPSWPSTPFLGHPGCFAVPWATFVGLIVNGGEYAIPYIGTVG